MSNTMRNLLLCCSLIFIWINSHAQVGEWTWIHGSSFANSLGNYGSIGIPSITNEPPAVYEPMEWTDQNGNFWMFGGRDAPGNFMNALWKYDPSSNMWTWMHGLNTPNDPGSYGTQGVSSPANRPPYRGWAAATWVDLNNNLWVFGGDRGGFGGYSDLWKYDISINEWTWMKGPATTGNNGIYGVQGVPSPLNNPGSRWESAGAWTDDNGDLWLFGGYNGSTWNDLWRYTISTNEWTWMKGDNVANGTGNYGSLGVEDPANNPSSRGSYARWKDINGNLWLFGGDFFNQENDMWRYNPITNCWTWMSGSNLPNPPASYGTKCISSPSNTPNGRNENRACWTDQNGSFWMFGGTNTGFLYNDLWKYCFATNEWTWVAGDTTPDPGGNWGTLGVSSPTNKPDARAGSVAWTDGNGTLYFFGGSAIPFASTPMNDLWKFETDPQCAPCSATPVAVFSAPNHICPGTCTDFQNLSINATSYLWTFNGANPGVSTDVNPTNICYNNPGIYTVSLIATNANGADTLTLNNFITVYPYPPAQGINQSGDTLFAIQGAVSYQWYENGILIPGATDYYYVAMESGNYNVVATDENDCEVEAVIFDVVAAVTPLSFGEGLGVRLFPNPVKDKLEIVNLPIDNHISIKVYNSMGMVVQMPAIKYSSSGNQTPAGILDASGLASGTYILEISNDKQILRNRFIKQ